MCDPGHVVIVCLNCCLGSETFAFVTSCLLSDSQASIYVFFFNLTAFIQDLSLHIGIFKIVLDETTTSDEDILNEKQIKYLIEPYNKDFKDVNPGIIFNSFKYKIKIVDSYAIINNENKLVSIVEIYENNKLLGIMKENNDNTTLILKKNDRIHVFIDKKLKFNVAIYDNNLIMKSVFLSEKKIEGEFGKDINLFVRHNNRKIFDGISQVEKLKQMIYPYNPFLNIKEV